MAAADTHRAYVFFDAAQLRSKLAEIGVDWRRLNLENVAQRLMWHQNNPKWMQASTRLSRVFVYDAVGDIGDPEVEEWLERNDNLPNVHVRRGALAGEGRRTAKSQKAVDVRL